MLRPSHCNGLIDNTYISILNCHFSPISLQNGWIFTFVLWCQMLASQIGCLKIFITFFPTRPHWMKNPPGGANQREICLSILYLCFSPNCFPLSSKLLHPLLNISLDGGAEGGGEGSCFQKFQLYSWVFAFSGSDRCSISLFCEIRIFQESSLAWTHIKWLNPPTHFHQWIEATGDRFSGKIRSIDRSVAHPHPHPPPRTPKRRKAKVGSVESGGVRGSLTSNWILNIDFWRNYWLAPRTTVAGESIWVASNGGKG